MGQEYNSSGLDGLHCQRAAGSQGNTVVWIAISFAFSPCTVLWFAWQSSLHAQSTFRFEEIDMALLVHCNHGRAISCDK